MLWILVTPLNNAIVYILRISNIFSYTISKFSYFSQVRLNKKVSFERDLAIGGNLLFVI